MQGPHPLRRVLTTAVLVLAVGGSTYCLLGPRPGRPRIGGWRIAAGDLRATNAGLPRTPQATFYRVRTPLARLEQPGVTITLEKGVDLQFPLAAGAEREDAGEIGARLPRIRRGSVRVHALVPVVIGETSFAPLQATTLRLGRGSFTVVEGGLRFGGRTLMRGERHVIFGGAPPPPVAPPPRRARAGAPRPQGARADILAGWIVDARDGAGLEGVSVRVTFSHADDGYPPVPEPGSQVEVTTASDGSLRVPALDPGDPRLRLHLEVVHPDYLPAVEILRPSGDFDRRWVPVTVPLRPSPTTVLTFVAPDGGPLDHTPVELRTARAERFVGEDAWNDGREVRPDRRLVRYTDGDGQLQTGLDPLDIALLHTAVHLVEPARRLPTSRLRIDPQRELLRAGASPGWNRVLTSAGDPVEAWLEDADGRPLANALVELELEGMPLLRAYTDAGGGFRVAPLPVGLERRARRARPRVGIVRSLSPGLWKAERKIHLPSRRLRWAFPARSGGDLLVGLVERDENLGLRRITPRRAWLGEDLSLVRRDRGGKLVFRGGLPRGLARRRLHIHGYRPAEIAIPPHTPDVERIDLGDVELERGESFTVRIGAAALLGSLETLAETARWRVHDADRPELWHLFDISGRGRVEVSGLDRGCRYRFAVEGVPGLAAEGEYTLGEEILERGLDVELEADGLVAVSLRGRVSGLRRDEIPRYRVVERYRVAGEEHPRTFSPYPLSPDGLLRSVRRLPPVEWAEVFVIGPASQAAHGVSRRPGPAWTFDVGALEVDVTPHVRVRFFVEGAGRVPTPVDLSLHCRTERYHEVARWSAGPEGELVLENLLPLGYTLRWSSGGIGGEREEMFELGPLRPGDRGLAVRVTRAPRALEDILVKVVDAGGKPIPDAVVSGGVDASPGGPSSPGSSPWQAAGVYRLRVEPGRGTRITVSAEGFLTTTWRAPPGEGFDSPLVLDRGARAVARVLDVQGRPFSGELVLTTGPLPSDPRSSESQASARSGIREVATSMAVAVTRGRLEIERLPSGDRRLELADRWSESSASGEWRIVAGTVNDLGTLRLEETRELTGTVFFPDGSPAPDCTVSLVEHSRARRLPQREPAPGDLKFSVKSDRLGRFSIDGLPLDLDEDLALVAHLSGWVDAVAHPIDDATRVHELVLEPDTALVLDVGYTRVDAPSDREFRLWFWSPTPDSAGPLDLGPVALSPGREPLRFSSVAPGHYGVTWDLREPYPGLEPRGVRGVLLPGSSLRLSLRVEDVFLPGRATFNARPLSRGWVLLWEDPGSPQDYRIGRVKGGLFELAVPRGARTGWASLVPERDPLPGVDFHRGQALPVRIDEFSAMLARGLLDVAYEGFNVTVEIPPAWLSRHGGVELEFPHYLWSRSGRFEVLRLREAIDSPVLRLDLLRRGTLGLRLTSTNGLRFIRNVSVSRDERVSF